MTTLDQRRTKRPGNRENIERIKAEMHQQVRNTPDQPSDTVTAQKDGRLKVLAPLMRFAR